MSLASREVPGGYKGFIISRRRDVETDTFVLRVAMMDLMRASCTETFKDPAFRFSTANCSGEGRQPLS